MSSLCTRCGEQPPNRGHSWCNDCYSSDHLCSRCQRRPANPGYSLCVGCYRFKRSEKSSSSPSFSSSSSQLCVHCNSRAVHPGQRLCNTCLNPPLVTSLMPVSASSRGVCCRCRCYPPIPGTLACQYCYSATLLQPLHPPASFPHHPQPQGPLALVRKDSVDFERVKAWFESQWCLEKGNLPQVQAIFKVTTCKIDYHFHARLAAVGNQDGWHFHGTSLKCNLLKTMAACTDETCAVCNISRVGFDMKLVQSNISFQRFGHGIYLAPNSSKCHDYAKGKFGVRALLFCRVAVGQKHILQTGDNTLTKPPGGFDSVYGEQGLELNYDEIVVYRADAVRPEYVIVYQHS